MNNIVILNALNLSEYAYSKLYNERNAVQFAVETAGRMPDITKKAVIHPADFNQSGLFASFEQYELADDTPSGLVKAFVLLSEGFDNIIYFSADCPLVDLQLTEKMYSNHNKYFCEYTFADGYPAGVSVEIIKTSILPMLAKLAGDLDGRILRNTIFSLIEKDINSFEIETEISPDDQRLLRVALYPDTKRNFLQLKSITGAVKKAAEVGKESAAAILEAVRKKGEFLRSLPVFFEFETTEAYPQKISYMPETKAGSGSGREMQPEIFGSALRKIAEFADDAVISLSIRNEPSKHTSPSKLAEEVLMHPDFSLLIETSGIGWDAQEVKNILAMDKERITWIIDLDALDRGLYMRLRGDQPQGAYEEAYAFAEELLSVSPANVWVQVVRMKENEEDTELFYKYWKEKTNNVIIQKYDWCCGRLEQLKVTDLSPVKRLPCWHLKREMAVLADGTVPLCRDDLDREMICGNLFTDDIAEIWNSGLKIYQQHLNEEYPGICRNCDEYYTYNY